MHFDQVTVNGVNSNRFLWTVHSEHQKLPTDNYLIYMEVIYHGKEQISRQLSGYRYQTNN